MASLYQFDGKFKDPNSSFKTWILRESSPIAAKADGRHIPVV
jgi:hypothetical protein